MWPDCWVCQLAIQRHVRAAALATNFAVQHKLDRALLELARPCTHTEDV